MYSFMADNGDSLMDIDIPLPIGPMIDFEAMKKTLAIIGGDEKEGPAPKRRAPS